MLAFFAQSAPAPPAADPARSFHSLATGWHNDIIDFIQHDAPKLFFILLIAFCLHRIVDFFVKRLRRVADSRETHGQRGAQLRTIASIFRATAYAFIAFIALMQILPLFSIDLKPLLASAGVVGLGISFGAQSIFKDMLNGIFILVEDQFNVGEVIRAASLTGTVEGLTLRTTTLRDGDGTQYFIPNSQITTVANLSREFSVASLPVSVDATTSPDRVMKTLRAVAMEVRQDAAFANVAIADPDILGVDKINGREVIYPVNIRVRANQKDGILRELRRRILIAFAAEGIPLGTATSTIFMQQQDPTAPPAPTTIGA